MAPSVARHAASSGAFSRAAIPGESGGAALVDGLDGDDDVTSSEEIDDLRALEGEARAGDGEFRGVEYGAGGGAGTAGHGVEVAGFAVERLVEPAEADAAGGVVVGAGRLEGVEDEEPAGIPRRFPCGGRGVDADGSGGEFEAGAAQDLVDHGGDRDRASCALALDEDGVDASDPFEPDVGGADAGDLLEGSRGASLDLTEQVVVGSREFAHRRFEGSQRLVAWRVAMIAASSGACWSEATPVRVTVRRPARARTETRTKHRP